MTEFKKFKNKNSRLNDAIVKKIKTYKRAKGKN
jgi:hypothetical protein